MDYGHKGKIHGILNIWSTNGASWFSCLVLQFSRFLSCLWIYNLYTSSKSCFTC